MSTVLGASPLVFLILTVIMCGGAAMRAGQEIARSWKPAWQVVAAAAGLAAADRFLVFALFEGSLLNPLYYLVAFVVIAAIGLVAWKMAQTSAFVRQYPWRYERTSLFAMREKGGG